MKLYCSILFLIILTWSICLPTYTQDLTSLTGDITDNRYIASIQDSIVIKQAGNRLIVENLPKDDILEVYNIMGVKVHNRRVNAGTNEYLLSLPKGYYILKIGKITKKIAIR